MRYIFPLVLGVAALFGPALRAEDWPQFRGPTGDGISSADGLPAIWGGFRKPAWGATIPGQGWSSPVVVGNRIWLTSAEQLALSQDELAEKLAASPAGGVGFQAHSSVTLFAVEIDAESGEIVRQIEVGKVANPPAIHASNSYASPTPVTDGKRLVCHFGSLGTCCLDLASGEIVWRRELPIDEITGPGSSPVLVASGERQKLIIPCDGADKQFVAALDAATGETIWQTARPPIEASDDKLRRAFSTPLVVERDGVTQAIVPGAMWVASYALDDGRELWRVNIGEGHATVPRPVSRGDLVYICTGFMKPQLWAIRLGGAGDVSHSRVVWKYDRQIPEIASPIVVGEQIYFTSSLGVLTCLSAATGELVYQHRLGGNFSASPLYADGRLYFTSEDGQTTIVAPGREFREIARNRHFGQTKASLAVYRKSLLIRSDPVLYCFGNPRQE